MITPAVLHAVETSMQRCYAELEQAERDHASYAMIERLYDAFLQANAVYKTALARLSAVAPALVAQHSLFDAT